MLRKLLRSKVGQGMTEYILIVALIAIVGIVVFRMFGQQIRNMVGGITGQLSDVASETIQ